MMNSQVAPTSAPSLTLAKAVRFLAAAILLVAAIMMPLFGVVLSVAMIGLGIQRRVTKQSWGTELIVAGVVVLATFVLAIVLLQAGTTGVVSSSTGDAHMYLVK